MKKFFRILLWSFIALLFVGTFVYLFMKSRPKEMRYEIVSPTLGDIERNTVLTGTIEPRDEIEIKPQVSGIISEINVEAGEMVKEGDVIARIKVIPDEGQLSSALSRIETAKINLEDASAKHERNTMLLEKKVISREEYETTATQYSQAKAELNAENLEALEKGLPNLLQHVDNIKNVYGLPCVVAINAFPTDTKAELDLVEKKCSELGVNVALSEVWAKGGEGGKTLAEEVVRLCEQPNQFSFVYEDGASIEEKLNTIVTRVYHGDRVVLTANAKKQAKQLTDLGFGNLPICMAKTQYSFSDDPALLGAPEGFAVTVRNLKVSAGAGFIVALTGDIMTMPGLPKVPAAEKIDVDENGKITGLF